MLGRNEIRAALSEYLDWAALEEIAEVVETAGSGNAAAQFIVGAALEACCSGQTDEAFLWFRHSANQGYKPALARLNGDEQKDRPGSFAAAGGTHATA
jgi:TPR repeat protein